MIPTESSPRIVAVQPRFIRLRDAPSYLGMDKNRSLERDARSLAILDPHIGSLPLRRVHHDTLQLYVKSRLESGISPGTINRDLAVVRRILNLSARLWRDEADRPWIDTAPLIQMQRRPNKRDPYPLSDEEQRLLFSEFDGHLAAMALFKVNTRDFSPSGCMISNTRMVIACGWPAWASRIGNSC